MDKEPESLQVYEQRLLSVISLGYLERAVDLWQMLLWEIPTEAVTALSQGSRVAPMESHFSASICILALTGLDGSLVRCAHIRGPSHSKDKQRAWANWVCELDSGMPQGLIKALGELAVLRDALVHNHLWEVGFQLSEGREDSMLQPHLTPGFGDKKHPAQTDRASNHTLGPLRLELIPTQLTRQDALIVLGTIWAVLSRLESVLDCGHVAVTNFHVNVRPSRTAARESVPFGEWLRGSISSHGTKARLVLEGLN